MKDSSSWIHRDQCERIFTPLLKHIPFQENTHFVYAFFYWAFWWLTSYQTLPGKAFIKPSLNKQIFQTSGSERLHSVHHGDIIIYYSCVYIKLKKGPHISFCGGHFDIFIQNEQPWEIIIFTKRLGIIYNQVYSDPLWKTFPLKQLFRSTGWTKH